MMRPRLLRDFGWRIALVLAKDWYGDRHRELERLVAIMEGRVPQYMNSPDSPTDPPRQARPSSRTTPTQMDRRRCY